MNKLFTAVCRPLGNQRLEILLCSLHVAYMHCSSPVRGYLSSNILNWWGHFAEIYQVSPLGFGLVMFLASAKHSEIPLDLCKAIYQCNFSGWTLQDLAGEEQSTNKNFCSSQDRGAMTTNDFAFSRPSPTTNNFRIPVWVTAMTKTPESKILPFVSFKTANIIAGNRCRVLLKALNLTLGNFHFFTGETVS